MPYPSRRQVLGTLSCCALSAARLDGQSAAEGAPRRHNAKERYELFRRHLELRGSAITESQFRGIGGLADWQRRRPEILRQFLDTLGLDPLPARTPLNARRTGGFERARYRVENIVFESMPGLYVTGNLYLPKTSGSVASPAILYVSGHSPGPHGAKVDYQRHGIWFAQNGFVALLLDTIEFGEIPGIHHGTHNLEMWYWLSLGYTPAAVEVWNAIRALDYLEARTEVDRSRIGMTGRSGGGAITWFTTAVDDRIKAAAPVHGTWTVGPHVAGDTVRENCDCIYFWNSYLLDLPAVGALIAPRPLKIVNAGKDGAFPPAGYHKLSELLRPVYSWHSAADRISDFELSTGHQDLPPYRKEANEWLARWLTGKVIPFDESDVELVEPQQLRVLKAQPPNARNEGIHKDFIRSHKLTEPKSLAEWQRRQARLLADLRQKVFRAFPKDRVPFDAWKGPERVWTTRYADSYNVEFATEAGLRVHGQLFVPRSGKSAHPALIYVRGEDDIVYPVDYDNLLSALGNHVVFVLKPRAVDYGMDNFRLAATKMTAGLLGTTLESMQLWDVLRSLDYLADEEKLALKGISVYARNHMSAIAMYAAALDERITRVIVDDPPESHWSGPAFLNVLRYTDIPEVAALIAPRELVTLTPLSSGFDLARRIARLYGRPASIREARALGDALRVWEH
jgi:cephalosporin-C deacetylase-like acetyl esterase